VKVEVLDDAEAASRRGAEAIAAAVREAVAVRGRCVLAASGGTQPWRMYRLLASMGLPWDRLFVVQVDERVAPAGDAERNWTSLEASLLALAPIPRSQAEPMPVDDAGDLERAAARYESALARLAGAPPVLDLVHLGLGDDGHTASLFPGDPALDVRDRDVAVTRPHLGRRRMTLTYPALDRARQVLWLVAGASKVAVLPRLVAGDASLPCGRVCRDRALLVCDRAAASAVPRSVPGR
jgi:6-phosphogluconolactonase